MTRSGRAGEEADVDVRAELERDDVARPAVLAAAPVPSARLTRPAGALAPPLISAEASQRAAEIDTPPEVNAASICAEWDYTLGYCACVRWTVHDQPYSARLGARRWASSADAPSFVDEWHAGPLTDSADHAPEVCFRAPSERWWSSASVVRKAMEQLGIAERASSGHETST